jgi:peptide/nickel transport system permease protein
MIPYIIRRRLVGTVVIWMVSAAVFFVMNVLPSDPAVAQLGLHADPAALDRLRELHCLDRLPVVRYADWLGEIARMDLASPMPITTW